MFRSKLRHPLLIAALSLTAVGATMTSNLPAAHAKKKEEDPKKKSPARSHIQMVEFRMKGITKKMSKAGWDEHLNSLMRIQGELDDVEQRIGYIKEKDSSWDTKPYEAFFDEHQKKVNEAHAALQAKEAAMYEGLMAGASFASIEDRFGRGIAVGFRVLDKQPPERVNDLKGDVDALRGLAKLVEECKANNYVELQPRYADRPRHDQPAEVCGLAEKHESLATQFVPLAAKAYLDARVAGIEAEIQELTEQGWLNEYSYKRYVDLKAYAREIHAEFSEVTKDAGAEVDEGFFRPLEQLAPKFNAALAQAAKNDRFPTHMTTEDASAAKLVADAAKAKQAQLVKMRLLGASWTVEKNALGVPLRKSNAGSALVQVAGEPFCRVYPHVQFAASHIGGGKYDPPMFGGFESSARYPRFQVSRCK